MKRDTRVVIVILAVVALIGVAAFGIIKAIVTGPLEQDKVRQR